MKKLLLLFFVLLVIPLVHSIDLTNEGSFIAGDTLNISVNMGNLTFSGSMGWNTTTSSSLNWTVVDGDGTLGNDNYTFNAADNGSVTLGLNSLVAETFNLTFFETGNTSNNATTELTVNNSELSKFDINWTGDIVAGVNKSVTVTAQDTYNNTVTNFDSEGTLTFLALHIASLNYYNHENL